MKARSLSYKVDRLPKVIEQIKDLADRAEAIGAAERRFEQACNPSSNPLKQSPWSGETQIRITRSKTGWRGVPWLILLNLDCLLRQ